MELGEITATIFQYGGTIIMAALFVWVFIQDKTKNTKLLEENTRMVQALVESNQNIAKSLDIISTNLVTIDHKVDRNYEAELKSSENRR